jgi:hypothetical protein
MWNIVIILGPSTDPLRASSARGPQFEEQEYVQLAEIAGACGSRICYPAQRRTLRWCWRAHHRRRHHRRVTQLSVSACPRLSCLGPDAGGGPIDADGGKWWLTVFPGVCILLVCGHAAARRLVASPRSPQQSRCDARHERATAEVRGLQTHYFTFGGSRIVSCRASASLCGRETLGLVSESDAARLPPAFQSSACCRRRASSAARSA